MLNFEDNWLKFWIEIPKSLQVVETKVKYGNAL